MKNWWLLLFFSCTVTGNVFSMQQAVESGRWFEVVRLIESSAEIELQSHIQVLLDTPRDLNTCSGKNDPSDGELDSGLFGILLRNSSHSNVGYALKELIRAKKIDVSLPNNQAVVGVLERGFLSVHMGQKAMPAYRSYLENGQAAAIPFSRNVIFIVCGIIAFACAYTWYTAEDEDDSEEVSDR